MKLLATIITLEILGLWLEDQNDSSDNGCWGVVMLDHVGRNR